jgi:hypothetical protein
MNRAFVLVLEALLICWGVFMLVFEIGFANGISIWAMTGGLASIGLGSYFLWAGPFR